MKTVGRLKFSQLALGLRRAQTLAGGIIGATVALILTPLAFSQSGSLQVVAPYQQLIDVNQAVNEEPNEPAGFDPGWWQPLIPQPLDQTAAPLSLSLEQVLVGALAHSQQVKVFSELPLIRETAIVEASAAFDWHAFLDGRWDDVSEPIGNSLTAGAGVRRFNDHNATANVGLRRRTFSGGSFEAAQRFGFQDNNSAFFVPDPQGSARLSLSFTQPLMRGRGKVYNTSLTVLAEIDKSVADLEFRRQLESHLLEVSRAYWALYLERAVLYQKINSYVRGKQVFDKLSLRREIDAPANQIVSAEASLKQRKSELMRARAAVKNAESRLRSLVNDPALNCAELIPADAPTFDWIAVDMCEAVTVAAQCRPEIKQAIKQLNASCVRLDMSKNELLPVLNLVMEAYASGLAADGDATIAWSRQLNTGAPSYGIGLQYEVPLQNRAAKARLRRRQLEARQIQTQYATTVETIRLEVEVAVREVQTSQKELNTKHAAMTARAMQLDSLTKRWQMLPGEDVTASLALENMLIAQERLAHSEFEYLQSQLTYNLALVNLKKATGTLLQHEQVDISRVCDCGLPTNIASKHEFAHDEAAIHTWQSRPNAHQLPGSVSNTEKVPTPPAAAN